ncbi:MAG: hypothetical protein RLY71_592 [Pseudomonadota bacterium]|jgi:hypothetical protein
MKNTMTPSMMSLAILSLTASLTVIGCGGGGGSSDSSTPTTQEPGKLMLSGVVATQTVQANAVVVAKCAVGGGNAHAEANGSYSLSLDKALLPCVLEADLFDGSRLHSVAYGESGATTATANLTPVTELVVANLAGSSPSQFYTDFSATSVPLVTSARANASVAAVNVSLAHLNVDASAIGNPLTATLVPAGTSATANTYGQVLVQLDTTLGTTSTTLTQLTTTTAAAGAAPHLPAELLSQPQASNCAALRSGAMRTIYLAPAGLKTDGDFDTIGRGTMDAATLTFTADNGTVTKLTANGTCRYLGTTGIGGDPADAVVSAAGVMVMTSRIDGVNRVGIVVPDQALTLADIAGDYNLLLAGNTSPGSPITGIQATFRITTDGKMTGICGATGAEAVTQVCSITGDAPELATPYANGGFIRQSLDPKDPWVDRWIAYRAGSGDVMLIWVNRGGDFGFLTPRVARTLPTVGGISRSWSETSDINGVVNSTTFTESSSVTKSVDTATSSYVRTARNLMLATDNSHDETFRVNWPRMGYNYRAAGSAPALDGTQASFSESLTLSFLGTGMSMTYFTPTTTRAGFVSIGVGQ